MATLVVRNIDPELKDLIRDLAKQSGSSLSQEAKSLIRGGLSIDKRVGLGTFLFNLIDKKDRGDDLVFEVKEAAREPPDFE
jgi:hypothetical protein